MTTPDAQELRGTRKSPCPIGTKPVRTLANHWAGFSLFRDIFAEIRSVDLPSYEVLSGMGRIRPGMAYIWYFKALISKLAVHARKRDLKPYLLRLFHYFNSKKLCHENQPHHQIGHIILIPNCKIAHGSSKI
ncbi:hypothetical protein R6Q59_005687 [Mikania micrantha]